MKKKKKILKNVMYILKSHHQIVGIFSIIMEINKKK